MMYKLRISFECKRFEDNLYSPTILLLYSRKSAKWRFFLNLFVRECQWFRVYGCWFPGKELLFWLNHTFILIFIYGVSMYFLYLFINIFNYYKLKLLCNFLKRWGDLRGEWFTIISHLFKNPIRKIWLRWRSGMRLHPNGRILVQNFRRIFSNY